MNLAEAITRLAIAKPPAVKVRGFSSAKIYPTGEGVLYPTPEPRRDRGGGLDDIRRLVYDKTTSFKVNCGLHGVQSTCSHILAVAASNADMQSRQVQGTDSTLGSSRVAISHKGRNRKGYRGISSHSKRVLRFAAATIERRAGSPTVMSFLTLTLPPMAKDQWVKLLECWGDVVRTFNQWLKRRLVAKGLSGDVVGCTELQPERSDRTGEPALHLHMVFQGRKKKRSWAVSHLECRKAWKRAVEGCVGVVGSFAATEHLVRVKKSASKYLAKYFSKGSFVWETNVASEYKQLHPTSWSFTPDAYKRVYHKETLTGDAAVTVAWMVIREQCYRYGEVYQLPVYQLGNGCWVKVQLFKLDKGLSRLINPLWVN